MNEDESWRERVIEFFDETETTLQRSTPENTSDDAHLRAEGSEPRIWDDESGEGMYVDFGDPNLPIAHMSRERYERFSRQLTNYAAMMDIEDEVEADLRDDDDDDPARKYGMEYLHEVPSDVPEGKVLVHNATYNGQRSGEQGFRYWLAAPDVTKQAPCDCPFAPNVVRHYRTKREALPD